MMIDAGLITAARISRGFFTCWEMKGMVLSLSPGVPGASLAESPHQDGREQPLSGGPARPGSDEGSLSGSFAIALSV